MFFGKQVSGYVKNAQAEQIESGAAIHRTFDELQAVDMSFDGAIAPGLLKSGEQGTLSRRKRDGLLVEGHRSAEHT